MGGKRRLDSGLTASRQLRWRLTIGRTRNDSLLNEDGGDWRQPFLRCMWVNVEPVVIHGIVVVVLVLSATIAALLVHLLAIVSRGKSG